MARQTLKEEIYLSSFVCFEQCWVVIKTIRMCNMTCTTFKHLKRLWTCIYLRNATIDASKSFCFTFGDELQHVLYFITVDRTSDDEHSYTVRVFPLNNLYFLFSFVWFQQFMFNSWTQKLLQLERCPMFQQWKWTVVRVQNCLNSLVRVMMTSGEVKLWYFNIAYWIDII